MPTERPANATHAVELAGVSKHFGSTAAVAGVSLSIRRGEVLTLLGPSGCGKSTILNMIAGFETPDAGEIRIDGRPVTAVPPHQRDTAMVFQSYALFPHMDVFENVAFGLRMRGFPKVKLKDEVARALEMVKLGGLEGRRVKQLSGGQQQRVALARAMVVRPKVLLLDEPLSALDKNLRAEMQVELRELHDKTGLTTVFVTHDQGEALSLSDRILVMNRGEIQQLSEPMELYRHPANGFVASFIGEINRVSARCRCAGDVASFELEADGAGAAAASLTMRARPALVALDGRAVALFIRPEHITIADAGAVGARNRLTARVMRHVYQGTHTLVRVDAAGAGVLQLRVPGGEVIERYPADAELAIALDLEQAVVLSE